MATKNPFLIIKFTVLTTFRLNFSHPKHPNQPVQATQAQQLINSFNPRIFRAYCPFLQKKHTDR